ncbi:MAG: NADH-quinone oxidoreductase subunit NuoH [Anaerolineae bacterium CG_4_9_14_3_um_filter_57_17]|nr:NADH-quinone oxidoreductase subunit NuoH [bacterium]NCT20046.1 NADH-quinone oxidoreductase subunit NuoH [bacterium]PJB68417.1 MAG: NADH-quinone oxidoreductase subunit NuoH [Anaerolineae bacterium CG_4_9_14_3_um_filter_57_17]
MNFWTDPIHVIYQGLMQTFTGWGMAAEVAGILINLLGIVLMITAIMVLDIFLVWIERKVVARFQDRLGPNRVGPWGIFQPFPDIIKLVLKEDITPAGADKWVFNLAPILSLASVIFLWAVVPLASRIYGVDLNVALLYLVASGSIGTLSIIMAGWSSNNKYALVGAYRMVANMVSYEIPLAASLLIPTILSGSMSLTNIVNQQAHGVWFFFVSPLGALLFLVAAIAELGRSPFDLNEGESEIVAGFHIEYTGMKFGLFYAGELLHAFTFGGFVAALFFGGWHGPWAEEYPLLGAFYFVAKAMLGYWIIMWIKYTVPRIRIDHMLAFNWKFLTPLAFALLIVTALTHRFLMDFPTWVYVPGMFLSNVLVAWATLEILRGNARRERLAAEAH